jgi:hypothetical protein
MIARSCAGVSEIDSAVSCRFEKGWSLMGHCLASYVFLLTSIPTGLLLLS